MADMTEWRVFGGRHLSALAFGLLTAAALAASGATAMVARMTAEQRVAASDLIVIGSLEDIWTAEGEQGRRIGLIMVDRVLKGDAATDAVPLLLPSANGPRSGEDFDYAPGTSGLWFLRSLGARVPGVYAADHPQRFVPEGAMQADVEALGG